MPKRILEISKTQPARTIVAVVAIISLLMAWFTVTPWYGPAEFSPFFGYLHANFSNVIIITGFSGWTGWAVWKNNIKHMSWTSFWWSMLWLMSTINRVVFIVHPLQILWVPFLIVSMVMAVMYLHLGQVNKFGESK